MAGAPFELIDRLASPRTIAAAREVEKLRFSFEEARGDARRAVAESEALDPKAARRWLKAFKRNDRGPDAPQLPNEIAPYLAALDRLARQEIVLAEELQSELGESRAALFAGSREVLPDYLVFTVGHARELLARLLEAPVEKRDAAAGDRERHLLLYLQRAVTKNDTLSRFGPTIWGSLAPGAALRFNPGDALQRTAFLERWTAHAAAAALNADPEIAPELAPRLHPDIRLLSGEKFLQSASGQTGALTGAEAAVLARCDGQTPAHALDLETLRALLEKNLVRWEIEVRAMDAYAFQTLLEEISGWRDTPVRQRWLDRLQPIAVLAEQFAMKQNSSARFEIQDRALQLLRELGASRSSPQRFLYAAGNPIGEDCCRAGEFALGEQLADNLTREAAPWIDLWRDTYAFVASRVNDSLRRLFASAPTNGGALPLPAFLKHCDEKKMPLTSHGLVAPAFLAFQEVKAAFCEQLAARADASEWSLTVEDCHVVRRKFDYPKFDEYTYPSADLQISAASVEEVNRGNFEWLIAEFHPPSALLQHCIYWGCPDKAALSRDLAATTCGCPNFFHGFFAADFTSHTTIRQVEAMRDQSWFVAPQRGRPEWRTLAPAETEVFVNDDTGDVGLRKIGSREYLGSFARFWIIQLGFHPFSFPRAPHMPRLRCGEVIVQRRSWTLSREELGQGDFTGVSSDLVLAVERLRAARDLPRYVYIRPTEQALRRSGAEGRDKDTKPVFIDLESYLFLEIFLRWLTKAGEVEATEMLPDPAHLLWQEKSGRRTFELRTLIVPRS